MIAEMVIISFTKNDFQALVTDCVNNGIKSFLDKKEVQPEVETKWFNITQLCEYLPDKPAKPTVYGWVSASTVPYHKNAKKLRFLKTDIDKWLMEGRKRVVNNVPALNKKEVSHV